MNDDPATEAQIRADEVLKLQEASSRLRYIEIEGKGFYVDREVAEALDQRQELVNQVTLLTAALNEKID